MYPYIPSQKHSLDAGIKSIQFRLGTRAYRVPVGPMPAEDLTLERENLAVNPSFEEAANVGTPDGCYVSVGADRGASLFVDPRVARHGSHSLRLTTPTEGQGLTILPFPVPLKKATMYRLSIWAKARKQGLNHRQHAQKQCLLPVGFIR